MLRRRGKFDFEPRATDDLEQVEINSPMHMQDLDARDVERVRGYQTWQDWSLRRPKGRVK